MEGQEYIIRAVIKYRIFSLGEIISGTIVHSNHTNCFHWFIDQGWFADKRDIKNEQLGYMTSLGRFVTVEEGQEIAKIANQNWEWTIPCNMFATDIDWTIYEKGEN